MSLADIAVGCALGYLEFRFPQIAWRADHVPMEQRRPLLLKALNRLYAAREGAVAARELVGVGVPVRQPFSEDR